MAHKWIPVSTGVPREYAISGVYAIRHAPSKKCYVGSSINCRARLWRHLHELRSGLHFSSKLSRAWLKHDESDFEICILEAVSLREEVINREQFWIDELKSCAQGFNIRPKAEANWGISWTPDQNLRRRISNKTTWSNPALRNKSSQRFRGLKRGNWTAESAKKLSESLKIIHADNPERRLAIKASLASEEVQRKRIENLRISLKRPDIYLRRITQLNEARKSPFRTLKIREANIRKRAISQKDIMSSSDFDQTLLSLYQSGLSLRDISKQVGMDHKSIANRLRSLEVTIDRRFACGSKLSRKLTESNVVEIIRRLSDGEKQASIAKSFGVSSSVISEISSGKAWKHIPRPQI